MTRSRDGMLVLIGAFKLAKGVLILALGLDLLRLGPTGIVPTLARWAMRLHIDPDGRHFARAVHAVSGLGGWNVKVVSAALFVDGGLFLVEGVGLTLRRRWAEYFTVIATGSFIPLEAYELARRADIGRAVLLGLNVAIVGYLLWRLRRRL
jgi:uncharacterized membrane protein (DUF2068 family)